jgi:hypothetical protein
MGAVLPVARRGPRIARALAFVPRLDQQPFMGFAVGDGGFIDDGSASTRSRRTDRAQRGPSRQSPRCQGSFARPARVTAGASADVARARSHRRQLEPTRSRSPATLDPLRKPEPPSRYVSGRNGRAHRLPDCSLPLSTRILRADSSRPITTRTIKPNSLLLFRT